MSDINDPHQKNPHAPYRDHWHKQQVQNETQPGAMHDYLREHHDRLSALTWDEEKKPRRDDP